MPKSVQIVLFCHSGRPEFQVTNMILELVMLLTQRGSDVSYSVRARDSVLPRARNSACADFLAGSKDALLMLDDDNYCAAADLVRLVDAPGDVVGAAIRLKQAELGWNIAWLADREIGADEFGQVEVAHVGGGILKLSRQAIREMVAAAPGSWFFDPGCPDGRSYSLFEGGADDHLFYDQDVAFCRKWRALGGAIHVLPDIVTHHLGAMDFCGSLHGWLAGQTPKLTIVSAKGDSRSDVVNRFGRTSDERLRDDLAALKAGQ